MTAEDTDKHHVKLEKYLKLELLTLHEHRCSIRIQRNLPEIKKKITLHAN
jgi:hypothetical protein